MVEFLYTILATNNYNYEQILLRSAFEFRIKWEKERERKSLRNVCLRLNSNGDLLLMKKTSAVGMPREWKSSIHTNIYLLRSTSKIKLHSRHYTKCPLNANECAVFSS